MLIYVYAQCHFFWVSFMLSGILTECHLCFVAFMLSVIYNYCHLCLISFMLAVVYTECHFFLVSFIPIVILHSVIMSLCHSYLDLVSLRRVSLCRLSRSPLNKFEIKLSQNQFKFFRRQSCSFFHLSVKSLAAKIAQRMPANWLYYIFSFCKDQRQGLEPPALRLWLVLYLCAIWSQRGVRFLTGENLKAVCVEFSSLS
jgi:hypothetical protein